MQKASSLQQVSAQDVVVLGTTPRSSGSAASPRGSNKRPSKEEGALLSPLASSHVRHAARNADHQSRIWP